MQSDSNIVPFVKKEKIANDTYSFSFVRPQENFDFLPGQYVSLTLPVSGNFITHDFSIASSPFEKTLVTIVTKKRKSGFKDALFALNHSSLVRFSNPSGGFVLDEQDSHPKVFLAGGIGVVPLFNMVDYAAKKELPLPLTLLASFTSPKEIVYAEELAQLAQYRQHIQFVFTVTGDDTGWSGEKGRISQQFIKKYIANHRNQHYYLAGSPEFVISMEELLETMGVRLSNIKTEHFTGY